MKNSENYKLRKLFSWCDREKKGTYYTTGGVGQRKDVFVDVYTPKWNPKRKKINLSKFMEAKSN